MRVASVASTFRTPSRSSDRSSAGAGAAGQALSPLPADSPVSTPGSVIDPEFDTRSRHASAGSVGSGVTVASQASVSGISGTSTSLVSLKRPMPGRPLGGGWEKDERPELHLGVHTGGTRTADDAGGKEGLL